MQNYKLPSMWDRYLPLSSEGLIFYMEITHEHCSIQQDGIHRNACEKILEGAEFEKGEAESRRKTTRRFITENSRRWERRNSHIHLHNCKTALAARGAFNRIDSQLFRPLSTSIF
jgi:hypothetical protein